MRNEKYAFYPYYINSLVIVDLAMGQIPRSAKRMPISSCLDFVPMIEL